MVDIEGMLLAYTVCPVACLLMCSTGGILLANIGQGLTCVMRLAYIVIWLSKLVR